MPRHRLSDQQRIWRAEDEDSLGRWLMEAARVTGWKAVHWRPAHNDHGRWATNYMGDGRGFPDWLLFRNEDLIAAELKREIEQPTPEQEVYLDRFERVRRVRSFVWRPSSRDEITEVLGGAQLRFLA